jgi:hypothetical protein
MEVKGPLGRSLADAMAFAIVIAASVSCDRLPAIIAVLPMFFLVRFLANICDDRSLRKHAANTITPIVVGTWYALLYLHRVGPPWFWHQFDVTLQSITTWMFALCSPAVLGMIAVDLLGMRSTGVAPRALCRTTWVVFFTTLVGLPVVKAMLGNGAFGFGCIHGSPYLHEIYRDLSASVLYYLLLLAILAVHGFVVVRASRCVGPGKAGGSGSVSP